MRLTTCFGVVIAFASIGCRQLVGFDESSPGHQIDAGPYVSSSGAWHFADPECGACVDRSCAAEAVACANDLSCQAYHGCVASCARDDRACAEQCRSMVPSAILSPETRPLSHCKVALCKDACPSSVATGASGQTCGPVSGLGECVACCCEEHARCYNDPDCERQLACTRQCAPLNDAFSQSCFEACTGRSPDPVTPTVNIGACAEESRCAPHCFAPDWTCLGRVRWPGRSAGPRKSYGTVLDFPADTPLADFHVKGCLFNDHSCKDFLEDLMTDSAGHVVHDLGKNLYDINGYAEITAPAGLDYPTYLFFLAGWRFTHSVRPVFRVYRRNSPGAIPESRPGLGGVLFFTFDCSPILSYDHKAAGVEVTAEPKGSSDSPTYLGQGGGIDPNATFTTPLGIGFITNLPPGEVALMAHRHDTGQPIGTTPIMIQAGAVTVVELVPTP